MIFFRSLTVFMFVCSLGVAGLAFGDSKAVSVQTQISVKELNITNGTVSYKAPRPDLKQLPHQNTPGVQNMVIDPPLNADGTPQFEPLRIITVPGNSPDTMMIARVAAMKKCKCPSANGTCATDADCEDGTTCVNGYTCTFENALVYSTVASDIRALSP